MILISYITSRSKRPITGREGENKMYFVIRKNPTWNQQYYYLVKASGNHATLATSEMYVSKQAAKDSLNIIFREAKDATYTDETGEQ